jgi:hypothetical protein
VAVEKQTQKQGVDMSFNYPEEGRYAICDVCEKDASSTLDGCNCPECPECHQCGSPDCLINGGKCGCQKYNSIHKEEGQ